MCRHHGIFARERFYGDVDIECECGNRFDILGGLNVGTVESEAVGSHNLARVIGVAMVFNGPRDAGPARQKAQRRAEGNIQGEGKKMGDSRCG